MRQHDGDGPLSGLQGRSLRDALPQRGAETLAEAAPAAVGRLLQPRDHQDGGALRHRRADLCLRRSARKRKQWVDDYYGIFKEECVPIGHAVNPEHRDGHRLLVHPDEEEARRRGTDGLPLLPLRARTSLHLRRAQTRAAPTSGRISRRCKKPARSCRRPAPIGIGTPDQLRTHLRRFAEVGRRPDRVHPAGRQQPARAYLRGAEAVRGRSDAGVSRARGRAREEETGRPRALH